MRFATTSLIKQVQWLPAAALLAIILTGLLMPGYSSLSQHMSELGLLDHPAARVLHIGAIVGGASVFLFGIGLALHPLRCFRWSAISAMIFGGAYITAGVFHSGPMHGLYGATMFYIVVPAFFVAELPVSWRDSAIRHVSLAASWLSLTYMWFMFSGLEPQSIRGLTQRIGALIIFGWYPIASYWLLRKTAKTPSSVAASSALRARE